MNDRVKIGRLVAYLRKGKNYTQADLARVIGGIGASAVSMWENGSVCPCEKNRKRLSDVFGVPESFFKLDSAKPELEVFPVMVVKVPKPLTLWERIKSFFGLRG